MALVPARLQYRQPEGHLVPCTSVKIHQGGHAQPRQGYAARVLATVAAPQQHMQQLLQLSCDGAQQRHKAIPEMHPTTTQWGGTPGPGGEVREVGIPRVRQYVRRVYLYRLVVEWMLALPSKARMT